MRSESTKSFGQPRLTNAYVPLAAVMRTRRFGGNPGRKAKTGQATHQPGGKHPVQFYSGGCGDPSSCADRSERGRLERLRKSKTSEVVSTRDSGNNYNPARARFGTVGRASLIPKSGSHRTLDAGQRRKGFGAAGSAHVLLSHLLQS